MPRVEVRFDVDTGGRDRHHQLQAEVMHIGDRGVGLKFEHTDYPAFVSVVSMFAVS